MAIKVKHDVNAAPAAAAGAASGRARRSMETARLFASGGGSGGRGGGAQGATAHPVAPMGAHAQLTHASAPAVSAHTSAYRDTIDDRLRLQENQNHAALERQELGEDAALKRLEMSQDFSTSERIAKDEAARNEWDRRHGILRQERDEDRIAAGTHEYGYSPEVQREYDRLQREYDEGLQKGRYIAGSDDERRFMEDMERKIAALPKTLVPRNDPEGQYRREFFTDEKGRLIHLPSGRVTDSPEQLELRKLEMQMRRQDAEDKAFRDFDMKLDQGYRATEPIYEDNGVGEKTIKGYKDVVRFYTDEQKDALRRRHFPQRYQDMQQDAPAAQQPSPFQQALQNWWQWMRGGGAGAQPAPTAQPAASQPESQAQPVIRQDSQGVSWEIVFDENGKPIGKRRVRQ